MELPLTKDARNIRYHLDGYERTQAPFYEHCLGLDKLVAERSAAQRKIDRLLGAVLHYIELHITAELKPAQQPAALRQLQKASELFVDNGAEDPVTAEAVRDLRQLLFPKG